MPPPADASLGRPEKSTLVRCLRSFTSIYSRIYHSLKIESPCQIPRTGPAILVSNHTSGLDPLLLQTGCPRLARWMMAREYFDQTGLQWLYKLVGAIPVQRTGYDTAATRAAIRALQNGLLLGVFPEGKIESTPDLIPFQQGIGLLALRTAPPSFRLISMETSAAASSSPPSLYPPQPRSPSVQRWIYRIFRKLAPASRKPPRASLKPSPSYKNLISTSVDIFHC